MRSSFFKLMRLVSKQTGVSTKLRCRPGATADIPSRFHIVEPSGKCVQRFGPEQVLWVLSSYTCDR